MFILVMVSIDDPAPEVIIHYLCIKFPNIGFKFGSEWVAKISIFKHLPLPVTNNQLCQKILWGPKTSLLSRVLDGSARSSLIDWQFIYKLEKKKNKHSTIGNSSNWFHKHSSFQVKLINYKRKFNFPWCHTTSIFSVSLSLSPTSIYLLLLLFFFLVVLSPFRLSPTLYKYVFHSYLYIFPVTSRVLKDIFLSFIGFLSSLILEFWLLRVFVLFKLSYMHLMR